MFELLNCENQGPDKVSHLIVLAHLNKLLKFKVVFFYVSEEKYYCSAVLEAIIFLFKDAETTKCQNRGVIVSSILLGGKKQIKRY